MILFLNILYYTSSKFYGVCCFFHGKEKIMQLSKKRGNCIRASDKSLVFRFSAGSLFMLFFMAMLLLNLKAIIITDWNSVTLFSDGSIQFHLTPYRIVTLIISAFTCLAAVRAEKGKLRLMKNVWWEYDKLPHMLIAGGTGGGKTYFILTIIETLLRCDSVMYVLDPKNADLADLAAVMPEVCCKKEDITACIDRFYDGMMERSEIMKLMENYKTDSHRGYKNQKPI